MRCFSFILLCSFFLVSPIVAFATVWEVPSDTCPTIQSGIDLAVNGDIVELADQVFTGEGNWDLMFHGKSITVRSQGGDPNQCIINCNGTSANQHRGFYFRHAESAGAVLEGIQVTQGYSPSDLPNRWGGGILCFYSSPTITNCWFVDNAAGWGGGMFFWNSASLVTDCLVADNHAAENGGGIYCTSGVSPIFRGVTLIGNSASHDGGGMAINACSPDIVNCTLYANGADGDAGGVWCVNQASPFLEYVVIAFGVSGVSVVCDDVGGPIFGCSDIFGNAGGDWVNCIASQLGQNGNISMDPLFCDPQAGNLMIRGDSPCAPHSPPNDWCGLIGAWPVGCYSPTQAAATTWGSIKAHYAGE